MSFRVGQRVVCVDGNNHGRYTPFPNAGSNLEGLRRGNVYTIRYVGTKLSVNVVRLEEIERRYCSAIDDENVYAAARFRPIVERKTDISALQALLVPGAKIREDA